MPKCKDCVLRYESAEKILNNCDDDCYFCLYLCAKCGKKYSIEYSPMHSINIGKKGHPKYIAVCPECFEMRK